MKIEIRLITLITLLTTISTPLTLNLKVLFSTNQVLAQTENTRKREAERLMKQGQEQYQTSQYEAAIKSFQQALAICKANGERQSEGYVLLSLGNPYSSLGSYDTAIRYYQQSLVIAREFGDYYLEGSSLVNLGNVYGEQHNHAKAIDYIQQALAISKKTHDKRSEGINLVNLGTIYASLAKYTTAIEYFQQDLAIEREFGDRYGEGVDLENLGVTYGFLHNDLKAFFYKEQSLAIFREIHDERGEAKTLSELGATYAAIGDYAKAIGYYKQSLVIAQKIKETLEEGASLMHLGVAYRSIGDYAKAIDYGKQSLAIFRKLHNFRGEGPILLDLGLAYANISDYAKAIDYYEQSLAIARRIKNLEIEGLALNNLGYTLLKTGHLAAAEKTLIAGIKIWESIRAGLGSDNTNKVSIFEAQVRTYVLLQTVFIAQNKIDAALEIAERGRTQAFVELLTRRLSANSQKQFNMTPLTIKQIKQIAKQQNATLIEYSTIFEEETYKSAKSAIFIWVIEPTGKVTFRQVNFKSLRHKLDVSLTELTSNDKGTLPFASNSSASVTATPKSEQETKKHWGDLGVIALVIFVMGVAISITVCYQRFLLTKAALTANRPQLSQSETSQTQNLQKQKYKVIISYRAKNDLLLGIPVFRWFLALSVTVLCGSGLFFWLSQNQSATQSRNSNSRTDSLLTSLISNMHASLTKNETFPQKLFRGLGLVAKGQKSSQINYLQQLHQILIQPIADLLPKDPNARVIFIPQSSLFLVPFPALQDPNGKYLIEKHTILTAPSIQVLDLTHRQRQRLETLHAKSLQQDALVVGNPTMPKVPPQIGEPPQQLPSLPGAEEEAEAVAALLKTQALTGDRATKQAVLQKMVGARIVHLATHGLLDDLSGLESAIALAPSGNDNGLLTAEEILDLKLNAELVVLSACDTGRGKITGDGVIGLSRSLMSAGVPSVVVSLWSVPDAPTASLMTEFYRNLQQNHDKAQALRQAMLTTMKHHPDPRDWAAFTLIGEAE